LPVLTKIYLVADDETDTIADHVSARLSVPSDEVNEARNSEIETDQEMQMPGNYREGVSHMDFNVEPIPECNETFECEPTQDNPIFPNTCDDDNVPPAPDNGPIPEPEYISPMLDMAQFGHDQIQCTFLDLNLEEETEEYCEPDQIKARVREATKDFIASSALGSTLMKFRDDSERIVFDPRVRYRPHCDGPFPGKIEFKTFFVDITFSPVM